MAKQPPAADLCTHCGPENGPTLASDLVPSTTIHDSPTSLRSIGISFPDGAGQWRGVAVTTFTLRIGTTDLEGRFICVDRRFVKLRDAAE